MKYPKPLPDETHVKNHFGYRVGAYAIFQTNPNFSLKPELNWSFNGGQITFPPGSQYEEYWIAPTTLDIMLHVRLSSPGEKLRPYLLLGPNLRLNMAEAPSSEFGYDSNLDFAIDAGFGIEREYKFFIFAPEIRYTYGLLDVNQSPELSFVYHHTIAAVFGFTWPGK